MHFPKKNSIKMAAIRYTINLFFIIWVRINLHYFFSQSFGNRISNCCPLQRSNLLKVREFQYGENVQITVCIGSGGMCHLCTNISQKFECIFSNLDRPLMQKYPYLSKLSTLKFTNYTFFLCYIISLFNLFDLSWLS